MTDLDEHHEKVVDAFRALQGDSQMNTAILAAGLAYLTFNSGHHNYLTVSTALGGYSAACVAFIVHQRVNRWRQERREAKELIGEEYNNE